MKIIKCSEFFSRQDIKPFLLGAFYSRTIASSGNEYFFTTATYKKSRYVFEDDFDFEKYKREYTQVLNKFSGYHNWIYRKDVKTSIKLPRADHIFVLENDLGLTVTTFFRRLSSKILSSEWIFEDGLTENKKSFLRGYMELRGSIDTNRPFITQDYFYNTKKEISKAKLIFEQIEAPVSVANINFRELQEQYVTGENKRNTQFRMDLNWYAHHIGFTNKYKAEIFRNRYYFSDSYITDAGIYIFVTPNKDSRNENSFERYVRFFSENVYGEKLSDEMIANIRAKLGFDSNTSTNSRSQKIVDTFRIITPDKCAICDTEKTYTNVRTGRQHYAIHHMISFANGADLDVIDNLVKVCDTCHAMMRRGSGRSEDQINAIKKILNEQENVYEFCSNYLDTDNIDLLSIQIQKMLK